jgi:hypothetical protein
MAPPIVIDPVALKDTSRVSASRVPVTFKAPVELTVTSGGLPAATVTVPGEVPAIRIAPARLVIPETSKLVVVKVPLPPTVTAPLSIREVVDKLFAPMVRDAPLMVKESKLRGVTFRFTVLPEGILLTLSPATEPG